MVEGVTIKPEYIPSTVLPYGMLGYQSKGKIFDLKRANESFKKVANRSALLKKEFTVLIPRSPHPMTRFVANRFKIDLAKIGLNIKVVELPTKYGKGKLGDYYSHLRTNNDYDIYVRGMIVTTPSVMQIYEQILLPSSPMNLGGFDSATIKAAFKSSPKSLLDNDLQNYYFKFNEIITNELPVLPLGILFQNRMFRADTPIIMNSLSVYLMRLNDVP